MKICALFCRSSPVQPLVLLAGLVVAPLLAQSAPEWTVNPAMLGTVDRDGRFARAYPIGPIYAAPEFGLALQLVHDVEPAKKKQAEWDWRAAYERKQFNVPAQPGDAALLAHKPAVDKGKPDVEKLQSHWFIPQLTSLIFPANRDRIVWRPPGGGEIIFRREDMEAKIPVFSPEGWLCQDLGKGVYVVRDRDGWSYRYLADGLPETLTAPSGRLLVFDYDSRKLLVRIIQAKDEKSRGDGVDALQVSYDVDSRPVKIVSGDVEHRLVWDKETGTLLGWSSNAFLLGGLPDRVKVEEKRPESAPDIPAAKSDEKITAANGAAMGTVRFAYKDDLLYAIKPLDGRVERLTWDEKNARLLSDGEMTYGYDGAPDKTYTLTAADRSDRKISVQVNVLKGEMTRTSPDGTAETTIAQLHYAGNGLMSEKRDSTGRILLHIDYNQRHLPVDIRTLGQPEVRQAYDDRDRLTDVWRGPIPNMEAVAKPGSAPPATGAGVKWGKLVQHITYEGANRQPSAITDAKGQTTRMYYDAQAQLVRSLNAGGAENKFVYDDWGRPVGHSLPLPGVAEETHYDAYGRTTASKSSDGHTTAYEYTPQGRLESRTEDGVLYTYRYDDRGRPTAVLRNQKIWLQWAYGQEKLTPTEPETKPESWPAPLGPIQVTTVAFTDPRGGTTKRYYDEKGRLVEVIDPLKERTSYRYNEDGDNVGWVDARGNGLVLTRDNMGRIIRQENAVGEVLTWSFDAAGRLATRSNGVQTATYHYDAIGRLTQIDYGLGQTINYAVDEYGRTVSATTGEVTTSYEFDELDRITRVEQHPAKGAPSGMIYTFTADGLRDSLTLLQADSSGRLVPGSVTRTTYDKLGRPLTVSLDGGVTTANDYDPHNLRLAARHLGNGAIYSYTYDGHGQLNLLTVRDAAGTVRSELKYQWNDYGLLDKRTLSAPAPGGGATLAVVFDLFYAYDVLGRLTDIKSPQDPKQASHLAYDPAGNLVESRTPDKWLRMEYDTANELIAKTTLDGAGNQKEVRGFTYDAAGRLQNEGANATIDRHYSYGYLDKITSVDRPLDGHRAVYAYDANGMMVRKTTQDKTAPNSTAPDWETWVWDGLALVQKGNEVFVNEPSAAGGTALMSRQLVAPATTTPTASAVSTPAPAPTSPGAQK